MSVNEEGFFFNVEHLLKQDYRGVNIAVYALATAGLVASIHKVRPVSKFSKASAIPNHFIKKHETLKGSYAGVQHSPLRVLINHRAPIYLPLWHSEKPPLPVKLWGVEVSSGNAVNWLECVAKGQKLSFTLVTREKDEIVSKVLLHLPQERKNIVETIDIGERLVELGFAKTLVPKNIPKNTIESKLAPVLLSAEARAKKFRQGVLGGAKKLASRPFRPARKQVQTT
ncbi:hypothetical protein PYW07_007746 [Mythimna separata]|uniref:Uncharacterized protein n=1 Tax=Mythimna separata TaxID=271217 RepID=A0AAD8DU16_MYTSE|nr:hypothetical protein PYW07_007746 [Mythimna separata]